MKLPSQCENMSELRVEIDALDRELVGLLAQRIGYVERAAQLKRLAKLPARIESRVEEVVRNVRAVASEAGLDPQLAETLWRDMIDWAIAHEEALMTPH